MIAHWMVYSATVALLLGAAAAGAERVARLYDRPGRLAWLVSLVTSLAVPLGAWLRARPAGAAGSVSFDAMRLIPGAATAAPAPTGWSAFVAMLAGWLHALSAAGAAMRVAADALVARMDAALGPLDPGLVALWLVLSVGLAAYLGLSAWRLRAALRSSRPARVDGHDVLVTTATGPAVVGLLRQRIVLPAWVLEEGDAARRMIVAHEREHVAAGDPRLLLLSFLALLVAPWNPALWWQARRLRLALELDCDARVLRGAADRHGYGALLLDVVTRGGSGVFAATFAEPRSLLERRIRALSAAPLPRRGRRALAAMAGGALLAAAACGMPHPDSPTNVNISPPRAQVPSGATAPGTAATPQAASASPTAPSAARAAAVVGPGEAPPAGTPSFTPYTTVPKLVNPAEVQEALAKDYPPLLRYAGVGGKALVWIYIDSHGSVGAAQIKNSSGQPPLDQAALRVATEMRFSPALNGGTPVPIWIAMPIVFLATARGHVVPADSISLGRSGRVVPRG